MEKMIVCCPRDNMQLRVPRNVGRIRVTCPKCGNAFETDTGKPAQQEREGSARMRKLTVKRDYKFVGSAVKAIIVIDGAECGKVAAGETKVFPISQDAHTIVLRRQDMLGTKDVQRQSIPSGSADWTGTVVLPPMGSNDAWRLDLVQVGGSGSGSFPDSVAAWVVAHFQGKEVADMLAHPNNRRRDIGISANAAGICVYYECAQTKGFSQWSTGREIKKYTYAQMGLNAPGDPGRSFWNELEQRIRKALTAEGWLVNQYGAFYR